MGLTQKVLVFILAGYFLFSGLYVFLKLCDLATPIWFEAEYRYIRVNPEEITNGWYWMVDPDGRESVCGILGATVFGYRPWNLHGLISEGYTFYRVPDMEVAE